MVIKFEGTFADILGDMYDFLNHITDPGEHAAPAPAPEPAPAAPAPEPAPAPVVPVAPAKTYTLEDLLTAAGPLMDQGKMNDLIALTAKYGVKSFTDIPEDQYGSVAVDLRALGAAL